MNVSWLGTRGGQPVLLFSGFVGNPHWQIAGYDHDGGLRGAFRGSDIGVCQHGQMKRVVPREGHQYAGECRDPLHGRSGSGDDGRQDQRGIVFVRLDLCTQVVNEPGDFMFGLKGCDAQWRSAARQVAQRALRTARAGKTTITAGASPLQELQGAVWSCISEGLGDVSGGVVLRDARRCCLCACGAVYTGFSHTHDAQGHTPGQGLWWHTPCAELAVASPQRAGCVSWLQFFRALARTSPDSLSCCIDRRDFGLLCPSRCHPLARPCCGLRTHRWLVGSRVLAVLRPSHNNTTIFDCAPRWGPV